MGGGSKKQKVGFKYYFGAVTVPVRQHDYLIAIEMADKEAWSGRLDDGRLRINKKNLFGGDEREGGFVGNIDVQDGNNAQGINSYLANAKTTLTGAMRGVVSMVWNRPYWSANTARLPKLRTLHTNITGWARGWQKSLAVIDPSERIENAAIFVSIDADRNVQLSSFNKHKFAVRDLVQRMKAGGATSNSLYIQILRHPISGGDAIFQAHNMDSAAYDAAINFLNVTDKSYTIIDRDEFELSAAGGFFDTADGFAGGSGIFGFIRSIINALLPDTTSIQRRLIVVASSRTPALTEISNFNSARANLGSPEVKMLAGYNVSGNNVDRTVLATVEGQVGVSASGAEIPQYTLSEVTDISSEVGGLWLAEPFRNWEDINPAHVLRTLWTDPMRGGTVPESDIGASFDVEAQRFFDEKLGLSVKFRGLDQIDADRLEIERHIDAMTYRSTTTGKIEIVSIRDNYDPNALEVFDDALVLDWSGLSRPRRSEMPNQLTVEYTRRDGKKGSITRTNVAGVRRQGRVIKAEVVRYPFVTTEALATRLCLRDLRTVSSPILSGKLTVSHVPPGIDVGSVIIVNQPTLGIDNVIMRVSEIRIGQYDDSKVILTVAEDKFATTQDVTIAEPETINLRPAVDVSPQLVNEASYFQLVLAVGQSTVDDELAIEPDLGRLFVTGAPGNTDQLEARVATTTPGGTEYEDRGPVDFEPYGVLANALEKAPNATTFLVNTNETLDQIFAGDLARLGEEIIRIDDLVDQGNGTYLVTCGRGCLDSVPLRHAPGSTFVVVSVVEPLTTDYIAGQAVDVKLLSRTGSDEQSLGAAATTSVTFASRAIRPYPVGNFQIDGAYGVGDGFNSGVLTWVHRDRTLQTTPAVDDHLAPSIGPETGVFYTPLVKFFDGHANLYEPADFFSRSDFFADTENETSTRVISGELSPPDATTYNLTRIEQDFFGFADVFAQADFFAGSVRPSTAFIEVGVRTTRGAYDNWREPSVTVKPLAPPVLVAVAGFY